MAEFIENQRDTLLDILKIEPDYSKQKSSLIENDENSNSEDSEDLDDNKDKDGNNLNLEFIKKIFCRKNLSDVDIDLIYRKLIAQISRRMLIISKIIQKIKIEPKILKNIIKLLSYETLSENCAILENKNYEIHQIIKILRYKHH